MKYAMLASVLLPLALACGCGARTHLADNTGQSKQAIFQAQAEAKAAEAAVPAPVGSRETKLILGRYYDSLAPKGQSGSSAGGGGAAETGLVPNLALPNEGGEKQISLSGGEK